MMVFWPTIAGSLGRDIRSYRQVRRLLERVAEGKHEVVYGFIDFEPLFASELYQLHLSPYEQNQLRESVERLAVASLVQDRTSPPPPIGQRPAGFHAQLVADRTAAPPAPHDCLWTLTHDDVGDWADRPLQVVLENSADFVLLAGFVRVAAQAGQHQRLSQAIERHWLVPFHAGGCGEIINQIDRIRVKDPHTARLFVLMDSDHDLHAIGPSDTAQSTVDHCKHHKIKCLVTARHEVENYIPQCLLQKKIETCGGREKARSKALDKLLRCAGTPLSAPLTYVRLWHHHLGLSSQQRHRDDLKARFGERWMQEALQMLTDEHELTNLQQFDAEAQAELGGWAQTIEAYL